MKRLAPTDDDRAPLCCGECEAPVRLDDGEEGEAENSTPTCQCESIEGYRYERADEVNRSSDPDQPALVCGVCRQTIVVDPSADGEWGYMIHICDCEPGTVKGYCFLTKEQFIARAGEILG